MGRPKKNEAGTPPWEGDKVTTVVEPTESRRPEMWEPAWQEYILGQLGDGDTDKDGHPRNFALHNLVAKNLGTIVYNVSKTVEGANDTNSSRATANHELHIRWNGDTNDVRIYGDTADCFLGTAEPEFARHAAAMAGTRAQSRTYRKALNLDRIISAEEATSVAIIESGLEKYITKGQLDAVDTMCRKLNINAKKFIDSGKAIYKHPNHVRWDDAKLMIEKLGKLQRNRETISNELIGYDEGWIRNAGKA